MGLCMSRKRDLEIYEPSQHIIVVALGLCVICEDQIISHVAIPCGHLFACEKCSNIIKNKCPLCKGLIDNYYKIYLNRSPVDLDSELETSMDSSEKSIND